MGSPEAPLYPDPPLDPSTPNSPGPVHRVGPRHLAGDDGRPYDVVADTLTDLGWRGLTLVRGRREPQEASEDRQVVRSTVLHIGPDALRWAQWLLPDEPFHLGGLPIAWQISGRAHPDGLAGWSAYFTPEVPGEVLADFLTALDAREHPTVPLADPESVLGAVTARGWLRDIDRPEAGAMDPTFTGHLHLGGVPPLIQDADPRTLLSEEGEDGPPGWQAWAEPTPGEGYLWAASFSSGVPHDLVAAFAISLASTAPLLRRVLPDSTRDRLL
ncbi:SPDY domain-containing protein [Streptomyces calidiresistens]